MLNQKQLDQFKVRTIDFIDKKDLDVGILMKINASKIEVIEIFGDSFARPDLKKGTILSEPGILYQNEFELSQDSGNLSNIPTMGMGADCGIRLKSTDYLITFDNVLGDINLDDASIKELSQLQLELEELING